MNSPMAQYASTAGPDEEKEVMQAASQVVQAVQFLPPARQNEALHIAISELLATRDHEEKTHIEKVEYYKKSGSEFRKLFSDLIK